MRLLLLLVSTWLLSVTLRVTHLDPVADRARTNASNQPDFIRSPGRVVLQLVSAEHRLAWADLVWLSMVQESGKREPSWPRVVRWTDIGTDLDPKYFTIYHAAGIQLAIYGHMVEAADTLLLKGWGELPDRWQLPMLLGYNAYFIRGDAVGGSDYMRAAADAPGSPAFLAALSGRMRYHAGDLDGAIEMLESMLPALEGPARRDAEERILLLKSEPILSAYDRACVEYRNAHGTIPSARLLHEQGRVTEPPFDLLQMEIELDEDCIARTRIIQIREFEAAKTRVGVQRNAAAPSLPHELSPPPPHPSEPEGGSSL